MNPQDIIPPSNTNQPVPPNQPPTPVVQAPTRKPSLLPWLIIILLLVALGISGYMYMTKNKQLKTAQTDKQALQSALTQAQAKVTQLSSPTRAANDAKRKADLALFVNAVKQYKSANPTYPSTEPTSFKKQFVDVYITPKLQNFNDPNTKNPYQFTPVAEVQTPPGLTLGAIQYQWPGACAGSEFQDTTDQSKAAARLLLETGETYCQNI